MKKLSRVFLLSILVMILAAGSSSIAMENIIFDTDMGNDCDDAGALAVLHALADKGEANILACMMWKMRKDEPVVGPAATIDAINTYYGRPDIPIGIGKKEIYFAGAKNYTNFLPKEFPNDTIDKKIDDIPDAIDLYRKILAAQPDKSVTIVAVGPLTSIKYLLASKPDTYSPLTGRELVEKKVKLLSLMGGKFPEGNEFNLGCDLGGGIAAALEWPGRVVWSGLEIGSAITTGPSRVKIPAESPLHAAYKPYGGQRQSWDLTSVLVAVRGPADYWDLSDTPGYFCVVPAPEKGVPGYPSHWESKSTTRDQTYLKLKKPAAEVTAAIDALLAQKPASPAAASSNAANVILDTSLNTADEAGALAMLHAMADKGEVNLLGCIYPGRSNAPLAAIDAINTYHGRPDLPVAMVVKGGWINPSEIAKSIATSFPQDLKTDDTMPDSIVIYRKLLAVQPDKSVTIICTGWQNSLAALLSTKGDDISPLTGRELVAQKVKLLSIAGGQYPTGSDFIYNKERDLNAALCVSVAWPTRVVYTGVEVGKQITAGAALASSGDVKDPVKKFFASQKAAPYGGIGMVATLYGVRGAQAFWDDTTTGALYIQPCSGEIQWMTDLKRDQAYLKVKKSPGEMEKILNDLMCQPPSKK
ncbi:MAG TPA: hypothetical protein DCZ94_07550 [Lentisphaeria bacterium]|nr:MAG: hypothetical protein A2X48_14225 [Lentisphaerae bacterium GWF2_49_21]HBC86791.1 hypothetical protein [Lentisphaeria bacterium]